MMDERKPTTSLGEMSHGLQTERLNVTFPGASAPALDDVSLTVPSGRVMALLGPSGCGKSTALRVIAGLQESSGRVLYEGEDLTHTPTHRRGFSLMFQDGQLFGQMNVFENVAYGLRRRRVPTSQIDSRVRELLDLVGLDGYDKRAPATLSGGQQQRVALARALAPKPRLLLLDEPLSALDRALRERLAGDIRDIVRDAGVTALFVTHDHEEALTVADDVALLRDGRLIQSGSQQQVWHHPCDAEAAAFLGYTTVLEPDEAARLGLERGTWALRRTAWRLGETPEEGLRGRVIRTAGAGDWMTVVVALEALGGGTVEARLPAGRQLEAALTGGSMRLVLEASRAARLP